MVASFLIACTYILGGMFSHRDIEGQGLLHPQHMRSGAGTWVLLALVTPLSTVELLVLLPWRSGEYHGFPTLRMYVFSLTDHIVKDVPLIIIKLIVKVAIYDKGSLAEGGSLVLGSLFFSGFILTKFFLGQSLWFLNHQLSKQSDGELQREAMDRRLERGDISAFLDQSRSSHGPEMSDYNPLVRELARRSMLAAGSQAGGGSRGSVVKGSPRKNALGRLQE